jgi:hypothetical protein
VTSWNDGFAPSAPLVLPPAPYATTQLLLLPPVEPTNTWWRIDSATLTLTFDDLDGAYYCDLVALNIGGDYGNILHCRGTVTAGSSIVDHLATPFHLGNSWGLALMVNGPSDPASDCSVAVSLSSIVFP